MNQKRKKKSDQARMQELDRLAKIFDQKVVVDTDEPDYNEQGEDAWGSIIKHGRTSPELTQGEQEPGEVEEKVFFRFIKRDPMLRK